MNSDLSVSRKMGPCQGKRLLAGLLEVVYEAQGRRHSQSRRRGQHQTPTEVVLRMLVLKHVRNWSYQTLEREVRAKTLVRLGQAVGPAAIREIHDRPVTIAQARRVVWRRKMRLDTTVVDTNVHYRMSRQGWRIQRESTPPG